MSVIPIETPALVASLKPSCFRRSKVFTVPLGPATWKVLQIISESCFFAIVSFMKPRDLPASFSHFGQISLNRTRPGVVSIVTESGSP